MARMSNSSAPKRVVEVMHDNSKCLVHLPILCPRPLCGSTETRFRCYSKGEVSQPRYFCNGCKREFTLGGKFRVSIEERAALRKMRKEAAAKAKAEKAKAASRAKAAAEGKAAAKGKAVAKALKNAGQEEENSAASAVEEQS